MEGNALLVSVDGAAAAQNSLDRTSSAAASAAAPGSGAATATATEVGKGAAKKTATLVVDKSVVDATTVNDELDLQASEIDCLIMSKDESAKRQKMWEARNAQWEAKQLERKQREEAAAAAGQPVPRQRQRQRRRRKKSSAEQGSGKGGKGAAGGEGAAGQVRFCFRFRATRSTLPFRRTAHTASLLFLPSPPRFPFRTSRAGFRAKEALQKDQLQSVSKPLRRGFGGGGCKREEAENAVLRCCSAAGRRSHSRSVVVVVEEPSRRLSQAESSAW